MLVAMIAVCSVLDASASSETNAQDARMVKIEKMRSRMSTLAATEDLLHMRTAEALHPAIQIDVLKQRAREHVAAKLTKIFADTHQLQATRKLARDQVHRVLPNT